MLNKGDKKGLIHFLDITGEPLEILPKCIKQYPLRPTIRIFAQRQCISDKMGEVMASNQPKSQPASQQIFECLRVQQTK